MADSQLYKDVLIARLAARRSELAELRTQIRGFERLWVRVRGDSSKEVRSIAPQEPGQDSPGHAAVQTQSGSTSPQTPIKGSKRLPVRGDGAREVLDGAEEALDLAQQSLERDAPDLDEAQKQLEAARKILEEAEQAITRRNNWLEHGLAFWGGFLMLISFCWMVFIWRQATGEGEGTRSYQILEVYNPFGPEGSRSYAYSVDVEPGRWAMLRSVLFAAAGGLAGAALGIGRLLYLSIPSRTLNPRSLLWYFSSPFYAAGLAGTIFAIIRAGFFGVTGSEPPPTVGTTVSAVALGLMVGLEPTAVFERIKAVVRAFFGTDEVKAPRLSPPQITVQAKTLTIRSAVIASPATRIVSVTAMLQTDGFKTSVSLDRGADHIWSVSCPAPCALLKAQNFTATIEARDESGNLSRSEAISVSMSNKPQLPRLVSSTPAEGGTLGAADPVVLNFSSALQDVDVALTGAGGSAIALTKAWDDARTWLTLSHDALPAGDYRLLLKNAVLPDGTVLEWGRELRFKV